MSIVKKLGENIENVQILLKDVEEGKKRLLIS